MPQSRTAFTLMELLVSITIMILLAAMLILPMRGILTSSKEAATRATILKLDQLIRQAEQEMQRAEASNQTTNDIAEKMAQEIYLDRSVAKFMARRLRGKLYLPQRYGDEARHAPPQDLSVPRYFPRLTLETILAQKIESGQYDPSKHTDDTESSEILYLLLTEGTLFGVTLDDSDRFSAKEVMDTDRDGLMEFVDAWGKPLRFYRWPTRLVRPGGIQADGTPSPITRDYITILSNKKYDDYVLAQDPFDISGKDYKLLAIYAHQYHNGSPLQTIFHEGMPNASGANTQPNYTFFTPNTYARFLIVSAGADDELGLYEPNNLRDFGHLAMPEAEAPSLSEAERERLKSKLFDNLTNWQLEN